MTHSSDKIPVRGGYAAFSGRENTHMTAEARAASRCTNRSSGQNEVFQKAGFHAVQINLLRRRNDKHAYAIGYFFTAHDIRCFFKIAETTVGARSDNHLIDRDRIFDFINGFCVFRQMRESYGRLEF